MLDESRANDIAIIGLALRVPGARDARQFWNNLREGVESIETRTSEQLIAAGESATRIRRKNYVPRAAELPGMADFDAEFFGFSPKDAAIMDPQHRHFLECAWEALEDAARPPEHTSGPIGVFAGCGMGSYFYFNVCSNRQLVDQVGMFLLRHTGNDKDFLATRVSYLFDLHGPSVNVQTACSTSLVAVHYAAQSLLNGECDMALAGGVTIELPHGHGYLYQDGEILSPDGHCRAFDHRSAGTVFGSGVGVVVLRRLADALADGDPIRAVIKATAINNDGAGKASYLAPSVTGQAEAIVEAQALAGVSPDSIQYVECHGTGTSLGDPIEIAALTQAFGLGTDKTGFCHIGSVKTNIGHLDTAAGAVSLIKAVLALENGEIPPSLGYEAPNPAIDFAATPFVVADKLTPWPRVFGQRRAAVNSLGVGGTNAHAIVEEAPARAATAKGSGSPQILVSSARSRKALDEAGQRLAAYIDATPELRLEDVAHSLITGRRRFDHRRVVAVADRGDAIAALSQPELRRTATHTPIEDISGAVLLFPGGGAQYPGMGRRLYAHEPIFARTVDEGLGYLPSDLAARIQQLWLGAAAVSDAAKELLRPSLQLPAILIIEVALARLWQSWNVKPTALIGHSMGEYAAACIAGVMTFERAVRLVQLRGELFDEITGGGMLSVSLAYDRLCERLPESLDVAVVNAPELCVVSGREADLEAFRQTLVADGIDAATVPINIAAHSRLLEPILSRFESFLRETPLAPPQIPIVSNLTGTWMTPAEATDALYWVKHLRSTVRFADGLATLAADRTRLYIEAGPGRTLSSLAKAQGSIDPNAVINSLPHADEPIDDHLYFLTAVGRAWATGLDLPIERLCADAEPRRVRLPTYPFQHQRYFIDRAEGAASEISAEVPTRRPDMANWGWAPGWKLAYAECAIGASDRPSSFLIFLDDTGVGGELVERLRAHGHRVTTVSLGDAFAVKPDGGYILCPELGREGYDALLKHLAENGGIPERLVHLWLLTADEKFRPGSSFFYRNQERGFYSLFYLAQALGEAEPTQALQITVFTNGMQRLADEPLRYPEKATVLGPAQVMPRELSHVQVRVIDIPLTATRAEPTLIERGRMALAGSASRGVDMKAARAAIEMVWDDVFAESGSEVVAYRDGRRWIKTYREVSLDVTDQGRDLLRERGVYLITGGLGDLAIACARDLAETKRARLALLGRLELPDRAAWTDYLATHGEMTRIGRAIQAIRSIEEAGGEVMYVRADLTNPDAVRQAVQNVKSRFGAVNGVLHAAGVVKDDLIGLKSITDIEDVLAPKVLGTMVLDEVLRDEPLDLFVLFSSTSTDTAPAGQVDYVAANAYLNAFAEARAGTPGRHVVAVHWGVWSGVGLAARAIRDAENGQQPATVETANQPLFDQRIHEEGAGHWLELSASCARHWLLHEHRLRSGQAVWPGTGYIELVAEAAREFAIHGALEIKDLTFLRPLYVPDDGMRDVRVLANRDVKHLRIAIESRVDTAQGPAWLRHAEAVVATAHEPQPPALDIQEAITRCDEISRSDRGRPIEFAQSRHLRTGPRWQVLREMHLGERTAVARLQLDGAFAGDLAGGFLIHPALTDIATGYAMELIPGYDAAAGLWVPANYGRIRLYHALPLTVFSLVTLSEDNTLGSGFATFDVTITDEHGQIVAIVEGFTVKQLDAGVDYTAALHDTTGAVPKKSDAMRELSPAMLRLAAHVEQGIAPTEGGEALRRAVATGLPQVVISSLDLAFLQKAAAQQQESAVAGAGLARPNVDSEFVAPVTDIEKTLAGFWSELLGIEKIGTADSFFDLGGHSLVAVRLFRMIKKAYAVDFPISVLFEAPTIAQCAKLIEQSGAEQAQAPDQAARAEAGAVAAIKPQFTHLVPMHPGRYPHATPLFICAGMFGNILNLRSLALHIGQDRPVYGLQARGLYGGQAPHETFEEMAASYLAEVRAVQPHGPYLLSGFSGGGLVAYEMAQMLRDAGESVDMLVLLDTPYPEPVKLSTLDRITIRLEDLRREKSAFFGRWIRKRLAWELDRMRKARLTVQPTSEQFHNEEIEAAFRRALWRYQVEPYDGPVLLLRPKLQVAYRLRDGRLLHADRAILRSDNGWSPYLSALLIKEVPGDHDSMVLEPSVRVLGKYMRDGLRSAGQMPRLMAAE